MHYVISVPVNENLAAFIGKKGNEESLVFFNRKIGDDTIVAIMPANKEDKTYYGMAESMLISGQIVISTETVDRMLGEVMVASSLSGKHVLIMNDNDVSKMVNGLIKDYEVCGKEELLNKIVSHKEEHGGPVRVDIDHAFPVKGIGTVLLGIVTAGTVKVHDNLYHSSGKQISVKSIQTQDVDVSEAGYGCRVGLAVKGIEHDEIDKGDLLLASQFQKSKSVTATLNVSAFSKEAVVKDNRYLLVSNFSHVMCKIDSIEGNKASMSLEKPISILKDDKFMLVRETSPRIFASGTVLSA